MAKLSDDVKNDLFSFICANIEEWRDDAKEYDGLGLTVACTSDGTRWDYQTGDNSFTGGAYSLPHWAVVTINEDSNATDVLADVVGQLEELIVGSCAEQHAFKTQYECRSCEWKGLEYSLNLLDNAHERVVPGELMPAGQCPDCGALVSVADDDVPDYTLEHCERILKARRATQNQT